MVGAAGAAGCGCQMVDSLESRVPGVLSEDPSVLEKGPAAREGNERFQEQVMDKVERGTGTGATTIHYGGEGREGGLLKGVCRCFGV